jgi:hypothetical protein
MIETLEITPEERSNIPVEVQSKLGKISVLEALATETPDLGISRSNYSSRQGMADFDDQ